MCVDDTNWVDATHQSQLGSKPDQKIYVRNISVFKSAADDAMLWPGFAVETFFVPERYSPAVVVTEVHPASAVALAGLKTGDVLVKLNGNEVAAYTQELEGTLNAEETLILTVESTVALNPASVLPGDGSGDPGGAVADDVTSEATRV